MADQSSVSQDDVNQEDTKAAADKVLQALDVKVVRNKYACGLRFVTLI